MPGRSRAYTGRQVTVDFELNMKGIARCALGPELKAACHNIVATRALPYAVSISPRSTRKHPHYQDQFHTEDTTGIPRTRYGDLAMRRAITRLANLSAHAILVEVGPTGDTTDGHRVLRKTLEYLNTTG